MSSTTRIGTTVAGYRLESVIGRGGMSVVYLAEHMRLGRKVALKLLSAALSEDESFRERFERESRRAAEIDHPNIVPIYDAGDADGQFYIAMRYIEGLDLKELIKRDGPLSLGRTLYLLEQAASALDAAHERDLVHRDVKPANILIEEPSERVFLTDFGVVKHTASHGLTKTGFFIGTVDYAAPEQIEGLPLDARTDVYALGAVLYECLAGRAPFDREAEMAVMHAHLMEPPPALTHARPDLPKALGRVIATAMAKPKDERYASCEELIDDARAAALQRSTTTGRDRFEERMAAAPPYSAPPPEEPVAPAAAQPTGMDVQPPAPPTPVPREDPVGTAPVAAPGPPAPPSRRRLPVWAVAVAAAAAVAAVAAVLAVVLLSGDESPQTAPTGQQTGTGGQQAGTAPAPGSLASVVPPSIFRDCTTQAPAEGATETAECLPTSGSINPDLLSISIFPDEKTLYAAYDKAFAAAQGKTPGLQRDSGRCPPQIGEHEWKHPGDAELAGRVFCYAEGGNIFVVWTHQRRKGQELQDTHIDALARAQFNSSDFDQMRIWWRIVHPKIGRKITA
jgi:hypothetical protein